MSCARGSALCPRERLEEEDARKGPRGGENHKRPVSANNLFLSPERAESAPQHPLLVPCVVPRPKSGLEQESCDLSPSFQSHFEEPSCLFRNILLISLVLIFFLHTILQPRAGAEARADLPSPILTKLNQAL